MSHTPSHRGLYAPELLESRIAPATIIVTSLADDGGGANTTLREAIGLANDPVHVGADTITFAAALFPGGALGTITLAGAAEILITDTLTIKGPGVDKLAISGADASRIFNIAGGIVITGSLFQSNVAGNSGGGIRIDGGAALTGIKVLDNIAGSGGRGGGLRLLGGPITLSKSVITGNVANDGGGMFYDVGTATIDAATRAATKGNAAFFSPNIGSA